MAPRACVGMGVDDSQLQTSGPLLQTHQDQVPEALEWLSALLVCLEEQRGARAVQPGLAAVCPVGEAGIRTGEARPSRAEVGEEVGDDPVTGYEWVLGGGHRACRR